MPNFHYIFREVRANLMTHIMGDCGCGDLLLQARMQRVALNAGRSPAQSSKQLLLSDSCQGSCEAFSQPSTHSVCANSVELHLKISFNRKNFLIPLHASSPMAITWKLFALCNWEGMGRASKSLTFSWKSFLCPSGLVKFGQAFLLPFGPWQITHLFRFGMGKRKGTIVPPAAEKQKAQGSGAAGWASSRHFCLDHVQIWLSQNHPVQK